MLGNLTVKERIIAVADELHSKNPTQIPKVADVRKIARSDMNTTSEVMKLWRDNLKIKNPPVQEINKFSIEIQHGINKLTEQVWKKLELQFSNKIKELTDLLNLSNRELAELEIKYAELGNEHREALLRESKLSDILRQSNMD